MNFDLSEEQRLIRDTARDFASTELAPLAATLDLEQRFPSEIVGRLAELGFMGVFVPESYGGAGADTLSYVMAVEELSRVCASTGVIVSVNNSLVCSPLLKYGTEEQKQRWLVPLAKGQKLGAFALTEPCAGSDAASLRTVAVRDGDSYVLNGVKCFCTNGPNSDVVLIFATIDPAKRTKGITCFIVEKGTPGFSVGTIEKKMGIRAALSSELVLEDVRIPASNRLGEEGKGFGIAMYTLDGGRVGIAAQALGIGQACLDASVRYAKERQQFGKAIAEFQAVQWMLADMKTELEASRLLTYRAAVAVDTQPYFGMETAQAKLFASETAERCGLKAVQIHGGAGYMHDHPVERHLRDSKITEIYEGTSEIQRLVITANLLNPKH
ncbi:MAG: acyl-CoA dehydrogenase [Candidatus Riflebacteria bacterium]|nr:acyl-CoA dehydrogenase [Candidatus Riflebacteria bacterium]